MTCANSIQKKGQAQPTFPTPGAAGFRFDDALPLVVCSDALGGGNIHEAGEAGIVSASQLSERLASCKARI